MITLMKMPIRHGSAPLRVARGHFATNHSHINYYVDITYQKTRLSEAKDSARQLVANFVNDTPVDTVLCLDGTGVVGTCLAQELTKSGFRHHGLYRQARPGGHHLLRRHRGGCGGHLQRRRPGGGLPRPGGLHHSGPSRLRQLRLPGVPLLQGRAENRRPGQQLRLFAAVK